MWVIWQTVYYMTYQREPVEMSRSDANIGEGPAQISSTMLNTLSHTSRELIDRNST